MHPGGAADGFHQLGWVVTGAVLEDDLDLSDIGDPRRGVAVDHYEIGYFPGGLWCPRVQFAQQFGAVLRRDLDGLHWR